MNKIGEENMDKKSTELKGQKDIFEFLSIINSTIKDIRQNDQKQYSLLSSIFNCFYENKTISLPRKIIYEYIHLDLLNYKNKMVNSFCQNGNNHMDIISEENYIKKTYNIISKNRSLINTFGNLNDDKISLDTNFIIAHKNLILINIFGKDTKITIDSIESKKKKENNKIDAKDFYNVNSTIININNTNNISGYSPKAKEIQYLNKKRKSHRNHTQNGLRYDNKNNSINISEEKHDNNIRELLDIEDEDNSLEKREKEDINTELSSLIEKCDKYFSLFNDNDLLKENELKKNSCNNPEENIEIFFKILLLNYQNGDTLKSYLNMINNDSIEFQNSFKSLIDHKNFLNDNSFCDNVMTKFSNMNKVTFRKEKCSLLIDKIIVKLKQLILEYNIIKKALNNIYEDKFDIFERFKEIFTNISNKQEKKNYVNDQVN